MRCENCNLTLQHHNPFETIVRSGFLSEDFARKNGYTIVICGPPGAGKTTIGLYFLHRLLCNSNFRQKVYPNAFILSLVETSEQIQKICDIYNFNFNIQESTSLVNLIHGRFKPGDIPDLEKIAAGAKVKLNTGDLLLVDGISNIISSDESYKNHLLLFLDQIKEKNLIAILIAEEYSKQEDIFLHYAVDGIIEVSVDPFTLSRRLKISKLRWYNQHFGSHTFRLQTIEESPLKPGVIFFPSTDCLIFNRVKSGFKSENNKSSSKFLYQQPVKSGVKGFDELVGRKDGPFRSGEQVLLIGPSGSGKFAFGSQFLDSASPNECGICISFIRSFKEIEKRMTLLSPDKKNQTCYCLNFSPYGLVIEEMIGAVHNLLQKYENLTIRLFIDGISSLRCLFDGNEKFESFLISFFRLAQTFPNVATIVSYDTPRIFASYSEIDIPSSEKFSLIIGFNFQEQNNKLIPGIVILKSIEGKKDYSLKLPIVEDMSGRYSIDLEAGWLRVGLLGGQREQVHAEIPFIKLFFENKSEEEVLRPPFDDFKKRYPEEHIFKMVCRHNPLPTHWSFKGFAGPGHSNTKLVELRKYVMDELRNNGVLIEVPNEILAKLGDRFQNNFVWNDSTIQEKNNKKVMVPFYADVGVFVCQEDKLKKFLKRNKDDTLEIPNTWDEIRNMAQTFNPSPKDGIRHLFIIPNIVWDIKNFISFFFELNWTLGWDYPTNNGDSVEIESVTLDKLQEWIKGLYFEESVELLRSLVNSSKKEAIPNPNIGGHYHEAIFARRWFSKIHLFRNDRDRLAMNKKTSFQFGIEPLPGINKNKSGISNIDIYCLGIIKEALVPETGWMLASILFEESIDDIRTKFKRGLPISKKLYETQAIQANLCVPPLADSEFNIFKGQNKLFKKYTETLNKILLPKEKNIVTFRRTSDIPRFFKLENLLSENLPNIFKDTYKLKDIKDQIVKGLGRIYGNYNGSP